MLDEACDVIRELGGEHEITVAFSRAGSEVVEMYGYLERIKEKVDTLIYEEDQGYSSPLACKLGKFDLIVVSPCTASTTAKIVYGIADSLVSNIASQALKSGKKIVVLPTDAKKDADTVIPSGKSVSIKCRDVDLANSKKLGKIDGMLVVDNPREIRKFT